MQQPQTAAKIARMIPIRLYVLLEKEKVLLAIKRAYIDKICE